MSVSPFIPTESQRQVLLTVLEQGQSGLVVAGPGMGKSRTALELARRFLVRGAAKATEQVLFLSFSNASIRRLADASGLVLPPPAARQLRFMTYHSCAAELLRLYGRFAGLPPRLQVIDTLEERLIAFEEHWDGEDRLTLLSQLARHKGMVAFDVLVPLASSLIEASRTWSQVLSRHYPLVVVDEFQDTSPEQWRFLQALGRDSQVVAFGDPNQIIYAAMHRATSGRFSEFEAWKRVKQIQLTGPNYRCAAGEVLHIATCMLQAKRYTIGAAGVSVFDIYRNQLRSKLALLWAKIHGCDAKASIAILAPSNALVEQIAVDLRHPAKDAKVPIPIFVQMARDEAAHDAVLLALAALKDFASQPNEHSARRASVALLVTKEKWSRARPKLADVSKLGRALLEGGKLASPFQKIIEQIKESSDLASCVRDFCRALEGADGFSSVAKRLLAHDMKLATPSDVTGHASLFDAIRGARAPKGLYGDDIRPSRTQALTYHRAKGREFDFVIMVVDPRAESSNAPLDEQRRLYYVCATRARKWLGIIHFGELGKVLTPVLRS